MTASIHLNAFLLLIAQHVPLFNQKSLLPFRIKHPRISHKNLAQPEGFGHHLPILKIHPIGILLIIELLLLPIIKRRILLLRILNLPITYLLSLALLVLFVVVVAVLDFRVLLKRVGELVEGAFFSGEGEVDVLEEGVGYADVRDEGLGAFEDGMGLDVGLAQVFNVWGCRVGKVAEYLVQYCAF